MKKVLVTGSSRGIGKAIAIEFAKKGYEVVINGQAQSNELEKTLEEIRAITENVSAYRCDVSDYGSVFKMFEKTGDIDVLVNNAGIAYIGLFNKMECEQWKKVTDVNLGSVFNCSHLAVQGMIKKQSGVIINISSVWGSCGASCEAVYSAAKGGINAFTRALGKELAPCGIRVNAISCGVIDTRMNDCLSEEEKTALIDEIPAGRIGKTEEVAKLAVFLASEDSEYINGQIITIDGGFI